jgi:hypothetical protein
MGGGILASFILVSILLGVSPGLPGFQFGEVYDKGSPRCERVLCMRYMVVGSGSLGEVTTNLVGRLWAA